MEYSINFGEHLTIDGYGGDMAKLNDKDLIINCLKDLPYQVGMHILAEPTVLSAPDNGLKDPGGWSGFVVIAESHVSIHTFPRRGFISIDVYTCKSNIDQNFICDYFRQKFSLKDLEVNFIIRGTRYPINNIY